MVVDGLATQLTDYSTVLLFVGLVAVFVVGYKLMQAVVDTFLVSVTSGVFFVAMSYLGLAPAISVPRILLFMVLGTALYLLYSSMSVVARVVSAVSSALWSIMTGVAGLVSTVGGWIGGLFNGSENDDGGRAKKQKKIILDESDDE